MINIRSVTISLPAVVAAAAILIGWSLANEYIHCVYNITKGYLAAVHSYMNPYTSFIFNVAVYIMAAVAIGAATCIIVMGVKKK
jgi:hypothetical protein